MKKSKIIVPALGLLLLSTAASVSGTVAWFTASTTAEANINSFAVKKIDGSVTAEMVAGVGTAKDGDAIKITNKTEGTTVAGLCDASFDHTAKKVYTNNSNAPLDNSVCVDKGAEPASTAAATTADWFAYADQTSNPKVDVWYAVSWDINFTYSAGAESASTVGLYFDPSASTTDVDTDVAATPAAGEETKETKTGFRIAFFAGAKTANVKFVWAPLQTAANCHYITSNTSGEPATPTKAADYAAGSLIASDYATTAGTILASNAAAANTSATNYIANFTGTEEKTLTVHCVAWFEGTDPGVVDRAAMQNVTSTMKFFTKTA